jgi:hypothetical protein
MDGCKDVRAENGQRQAHRHATLIHERHIYDFTTAISESPCRRAIAGAQRPHGRLSPCGMGGTQQHGRPPSLSILRAAW